MKCSSRRGCTTESIQKSLLQHFKYSRAKAWGDRNKVDLYFSLAAVLKDRLVDGLLDTEKRYQQAKSKRLYYLSMEFLIGRLLGNNLINLGLYDSCSKVLAELDVDIEDLREVENDAALGNGGLGRLAACYLDSMATLDLPGFGYGINYEFGLFKQEIHDGNQVEKPDQWLGRESAWQIKRDANRYLIPLYGKVVHSQDRLGNYNPMWMDWKLVVGLPYDIPVAGYGGKTVNYLRLFTALSSSDFDISIFNEGDYIEAVRQKISSENISKILYPMDSFEKGRELRLVQEYFLVACSVRDIVNHFLKDNDDFCLFPDKVAIQLNDTHPSLTVAELMRLLVDEKDLSWESAWDITTRTCAVTNHTLLPEALETWTVRLFEKVLPRHLQIIYEINRRFLEEVDLRWPCDEWRRRQLSLIEEGAEKRVRMINLAVVGSHSVNGVAALHSELVKKELLPEFYAMWPERFNNKTNGITPRRWLLKANPKLAAKITECIGEEWITNLDELRRLSELSGDAKLGKDFLKIKRACKERLGKIILQTTGELVDPDSMFDIQAKRFHEYKRQLLNILRIVYDYIRICDDGYEPEVKRTYIFSGKAAPGYWLAKLHIKMINNLVRIVNRDPKASRFLKVIFIPDYKVSLAEKIIPAADLSEQISTAGKEASGTGNMKFSLNGALTIGTWDGANIEIAEEVGEDNIFIFGLRIDEIKSLRQQGYNPWDYYYRHEEISRVLDAIRENRFCPEEPGLFTEIFNSLLNQGDYYLLLADFSSYVSAQQRVSDLYATPNAWAEKAIRNIAGMGKFSSDRAIRQYAEEIWKLPPVV